MDEDRKRVLIVAAVLAARKLANLDPRPSPALNFAIAEAVEKAERILQRIDSVAWALKASWRFSVPGRIMRKIDSVFAGYDILLVWPQLPIELRPQLD